MYCIASSYTSYPTLYAPNGYKTNFRISLALRLNSKISHVKGE